MKKIFAILLALALLCSVAVIPVSAETVAVSSPWVKLLGATDVTTTTENGETIYKRIKEITRSINCINERIML